MRRTWWTQRRWIRGVMFVLAVTVWALAIVGLRWERESSAAPRRPIPRAADSVDRAADAWRGVACAVLELVNDFRDQGHVEGEVAVSVRLAPKPELVFTFKVKLPPRE